MENYILDLIEDNNRVIIPNFGAFIISRDNGVNILFNNFLSFNDGLLVNFIAGKKGIDTITATDQVYDYVNKVKKELDDKGVFTFDKLGTFKKDDSGILRFQQETNASLNNEIKEETSVDNNNTNLLDIQKDNEPVENENTEVSSKIEEEVKEEVVVKEPVLTIDDSEEEIKEEKPSVKKESKVVTTPPVKATQKASPKKESNASSSVILAMKEKKRKERKTFLIIAGVVALAVIAFFLFQSKPKQTIEPTKKPMVQKVDSAKIKQQEALRLQKEREAFVADSLRRVEEEKLSISNKYHLIVGSFKVEKNAENMVISLHNKGYNNAQYFDYKGKYFVSIDNSKKYGAMEKTQQAVMDKEQMSCWIFKMK